jgi:hypothetical protein
MCFFTNSHTGHYRNEDRIHSPLSPEFFLQVGDLSLYDVEPGRLAVADNSRLDDRFGGLDWFGGLLLACVDRRSEVPELGEEHFNNAVIYCPP